MIHGARRDTGALLSIVIASTMTLSPCAYAAGSTTAYKCVVEGRTIFTDRPWTVGQQSTYSIDSSDPLPADRAAAAARLREDRRALAALERERATREAVTAVPNRVPAERDRQARTCARLTVRATRAAEDYQRAGPRDQYQKQIRSRRAEEDRAAACQKRR